MGVMSSHDVKSCNWKTQQAKSWFAIQRIELANNLKMLHQTNTVDKAHEPSYTRKNEKKNLKTIKFLDLHF